MANVTVLPDDYDGLKREYLILRKELDSLKQELYDKQREIKRLTALDLEYQTEIEILQSEEVKRKEKLQEQILHYEETVNVVRSRHNERLQELELDVTRKEEIIATLQSEIDLLKCTNISVTTKEDPNKLIEEIIFLKDENGCYINNIEEMKRSLEHLHGRNLGLDNSLKELTEELINLKECLSCKREELDEANVIIEKLNDEMLEIKNELDSCRRQPLDKESKGNSLFAEVDDRRVYLQNTVSNMKSEYIAMKQERSRNLSMIRHLKLENQRLLERWESEIREKEEDEDTVIKAYKNKIRVLEDLIQGYKNDLESKEKMNKIGGNEEYSFCELMLKSKTEEINDLRNKISLASTTERLLSTALREANAQKRHWWIEATLKENILYLKSAECLSDEDISKLRQAIEKKADIENNSMCQKNNSIQQICESQKIICEECKEIVKLKDSKEEKEAESSILVPEVHVEKFDTKGSIQEIVIIDDSTDSENILIVSDNQTESVSPSKSENDFKNPRKVKNEADEVIQIFDENISDDCVSSQINNENSNVEEFRKFEKEEHIQMIKTEHVPHEHSELDEEKENNPIELLKANSELVKKVTFTENTVSPIVRNPSKLRGKITILKPVLFD